MTLPEDDTPYEFPDPPPPKRPWAWIGLIGFVVLLLTFGGLLLSNRVAPAVATERSIAASATAAVVLGSGGLPVVGTPVSQPTPNLIATVQSRIDGPTWVIDVYPHPNQIAISPLGPFSWNPTGDLERPIADYSFFSYAPPDDGQWVRVCVALDTAELARLGIEVLTSAPERAFQAVELQTETGSPVPWYGRTLLETGNRQALVRCTWLAFTPEQRSITLRLQVTVENTNTSFGWTFRTQP